MLLKIYPAEMKRDILFKLFESFFYKTTKAEIHEIIIHMSEKSLVAGRASKITMSSPVTITDNGLHNISKYGIRIEKIEAN
jgi:hypothetical protein